MPKVEFKIQNLKFRICLIAVLSLLVLSGFVSPALAQNSFQPSAFSNQQTQPSTSNTQTVLDTVLNSVAGCMIAGTSLIEGEKCKDEGKQISALSFLGQGIAAVSTPPLSSNQALANFSSSLGIIEPVYAQNVTGSGANIIKPVEALWQVLRNLAYSLYIILFLVVGLMLMFRQKMNPQTVISVQAALPGLIIGLVLITFSYLIAAAIVDLTFLFIPLVAVIFDQASPNNVFKGTNAFFEGTQFANNATLLELSQNANFFSFWKAFLLNKGFYLDIFGNTGQNFGIDPTNILISLLNTIIEILKGATNIIVAIVVIIAIFIQMLRLFIQLVRAYITIMVYTALGPVMILVSSIPGRSKGLENWWKTILANALIFPAVFASFFFGGMIIGDAAIINQSAFQYTMPFFSGLPVQIISYIIGLMVILGTPAVPGLVKEALGVKDMKGFPEAFKQGADSGFSPVKGLVTKPFSRMGEEAKAYREARLKTDYPYGDQAALDKRARSRPWVKWLSGV